MVRVGVGRMLRRDVAAAWGSRGECAVEEASARMCCWEDATEWGWDMTDGVRRWWLESVCY